MTCTNQLTMQKRSLWTDRFNSIMPWGSSTCSKAPALLPDEPAVIVRGAGCRIWDDLGREFIDFRNGLGPITLGYGFPAVDDAIREQLENGIVYGQPHPLECEVAEMLQRIVPCADQVRFLKTGGEAVAATIRLARAYTGRDRVIQVGYNGWLNVLASDSMSLPQRKAAKANGVPEVLARLHHTCPWGDVEAMGKLFDRYSDEIAAIVIAANYRDMEQGASYLPVVRRLADTHGTMLVFDEIVTGFRIANGGIQEYFKVVPDLAVFAKGIANGMPLSAYMGKHDVMRQARQTIISSTNAGETLSLAATRATLETYLNEDVVGYLWQQGERLWTAASDILQRHKLPVRLMGFYPCVQWVFDDPTIRAPLFRAAYRCGLSLYDVSYVNYSHRDHDIDEALSRLNTACTVAKQMM